MSCLDKTFRRARATRKILVGNRVAGELELARILIQGSIA